MSDGLIWLLVGALVPLVWYSVLPSVRKPNLSVLLALGVTGAVLGGALGEMAMVEFAADLATIAGGVGAGLGSLVFTMAFRLVSDMLHAPTPQQPQTFDATLPEGTVARRTRTI